MVSRAKVGQGMWFVEGGETAIECVTLAYGLEEGARRFYRDLAGRADPPEVRDLFSMLAEAEVRHEDRLWEEYRKAGGEVDRSVFGHDVVPRAVEGGLTADQVLARWGQFPLTAGKALGMAMALETDSFDLYLRMARAMEGAEAQQVFLSLAEEEKEHLRQLGRFRGQWAQE